MTAETQNTRSAISLPSAFAGFWDWPPFKLRIWICMLVFFDFQPAVRIRQRDVLRDGTPGAQISERGFLLSPGIDLQREADSLERETVERF